MQMILTSTPSTDGTAASGSSPIMHTGCWADLSVQAQFLIDLEFLTRYTSPIQQQPASHGMTVDTACVYTKCPPYLFQLSCQFPWVHFYAFSAPASPEGEEESDTYDPDQPDIVTRTMPTLHTEYNRTVSPFEFSKDSAITLSKAKESRPTQNKVVMICHGESSTRQLALHALLRADFSLLDICGTIPEEYLEGELIFPIFIPNNKVFVSMVATQTCKCAIYDPDIFKEEIGRTLPLSSLVRFPVNNRDLRKYKQVFSKALYVYQRHMTRRARI